MRYRNPETGEMLGWFELQKRLNASISLEQSNAFGWGKVEDAPVTNVPDEVIIEADSVGGGA